MDDTVLIALNAAFFLILCCANLLYPYHTDSHGLATFMPQPIASANTCIPLPLAEQSLRLIQLIYNLPGYVPHPVIPRMDCDSSVLNLMPCPVVAVNGRA